VTLLWGENFHPRNFSPIGLRAPGGLTLSFASIFFILPQATWHRVTVKTLDF